MKIPRWTGWDFNTAKLDLICLSDGCANGYDAVVYSRMKSEVCYRIRLIVARGPIIHLTIRVNQELEAWTISMLELQNIVVRVLSRRMEKPWENSHSLHGTYGLRTFAVVDSTPTRT